MREEMNRRLDRLVTCEAAAAETRRVDERFSIISQQIVDQHDERVRAMGAEKEGREKGDEALLAGLYRFVNNVRWTITALVIPVLGLIVTTVLALRKEG